jgi:hypothetical protein
MQLSDYIGNSILILIPKIHEKKYQKVILHGVEASGIWIESQMRIPMMAISRSEVMAISAERSDARLFQFGSVIGMRQGV